MQANDLEKYLIIYSDKRRLYESFCSKLKDLLISILNDSNIPYHFIESRVKTTDSLKEKLYREGKNYKNPLEEITDFVGLRIILYYPKDVDNVVDIITKEFLIDTKNSIDKKKLLKENEFGYLSVHQIIGLNEIRSSLPEWNSVKDLKAEIQIRTVLQHAWASISHTLQYKREIDIPTQLRRKLNRLAGLLELADEEFESLNFQQNELELKISESIKKNNFNLPIDYLTVEDYLRKSKIFREIKDYISLRKNILEENNKDMSISQLVLVLSHFNVNTIKELDEILNDNKNNVAIFFDILMPIKSKTKWIGSVETFLIIFLMGLLKKDENDLRELYKKLDWVDSFLFNELIKS